MGPTFGMLMFPDVEELDFVGPWEVFSSAVAAYQYDPAPPYTAAV